MNALISHQHLTERVAGYVHAHTLYSSVRPFGVSLIIGSIEKDGPQMYLVEPSGVSWVSRLGIYHIVGRVAVILVLKLLQLPIAKILKDLYYAVLLCCLS